MTKSRIAPVRPEDLRRAHAVAMLAWRLAGSPDSRSLHPNDHPISIAIAEKFPADQAESLTLRVFMLEVFLQFGEASRYVNTVSTFGIPELHPAIFDVAADQPLSTRGVDHALFFRAVARRAESYDTLRG